MNAAACPDDPRAGVVAVYTASHGVFEVGAFPTRTS